MDPILEKLVRKYPDLAACVPDIEQAIRLLTETYSSGGQVLVCGNGGSAADAEHLVGELMKGYLTARPVPAELAARLRENYPEHGQYLAEHLQGALPTISLVSQVSLMTAFANDVAPDMIFAQQVYGYGRPGDVLIGISTSGSSGNVLHALRVARVLRLKTIGFTGIKGSAMQPYCDVLIRVPWELTGDIQERHLAIYHVLCARVEQNLFP